MLQKNFIHKGNWYKEKETRFVCALWLFTHDGLTEKTEVFARENGIYWSSREEFDELLAHVGLRRLPEVG